MYVTSLKVVAFRKYFLKLKFLAKIILFLFFNAKSAKKVLNVFPLIYLHLCTIQKCEDVIEELLCPVISSWPGRIYSKHFYNSPKQVRQISRMSGKFSRLREQILTSQISKGTRRSIQMRLIWF